LGTPRAGLRQPSSEESHHGHLNSRVGLSHLRIGPPSNAQARSEPPCCEEGDLCVHTVDDVAHRLNVVRRVFFWRSWAGHDATDQPIDFSARCNDRAYRAYRAQDARLKVIAGTAGDGKTYHRYASRRKSAVITRFGQARNVSVSAASPACMRVKSRLGSSTYVSNPPLRRRLCCYIRTLRCD